MKKLPDKIIIFDTEYTSWEGSIERKFSGPNEHRELVQIAAIKVDTTNFKILDTFEIFIKPKINPQLSDYFMKLTKISQKEVDKKGVSLSKALKEFKKFIGDLPSYSYGSDQMVMKKNCQLIKIKFPFSQNTFFDIKKYFISCGIPAQNYNSGSITEAFGVKRRKNQHNALNDCLSILDGLKFLRKKGRN